jgi:hypothetical protein
VAQPNLLLEIRRLQETRESGVLFLTKLDQRVNISYREVIQAASSIWISPYRSLPDS